MERRTLIQKATGLGLLAGLAGNKMVFAADLTAGNSPALDGAQAGNRHGELTQRIGALEERGGGTLELGDGVYEISKPLRLPTSVSLVMTPNAIIRAQVTCPQSPHTDNTTQLAVAAVGKWETPTAFSKWTKSASFPPLFFAANSAGVL